MTRHSISSPKHRHDRPVDTETKYERPAARGRGRHRTYAARRHPWPILAAAALLAVSSLSFTQGETVAAGAAVANTWPVRMNVDDGMHRAVSVGLGRAPLGGGYSTAGVPAELFQVQRSKAVVGPVPSARLATASLPSVREADEELRLAFSMPARPGRGAGEYVKLELRRQSGGAAYRVGVQVLPNGKMIAGFSRVRGYQEEQIGSYRTLPQRALAGQKVYLDAIVTGSKPTTLQMRAWTAGTPNPAWQLTFRDSSSRQVLGRGSVGFTIYTSRTSPATRVTVYELDGWALGPPPRRPVDAGQTTPPSPSPSSSASAKPALSASVTHPSATPPNSQAAPPNSTEPSMSPTSSPVSTPPPASDDSSRGSLAVGTARYPVPAGALFVSATNGSDGGSGSVGSPLKTVAAAIARAGSGRSIVLRAGTYHESLFVGASKSLRIQAYPGEAVWFDGSAPVTGWTQRGSTWVASGWTAQFDHSASFTTGSDAGGFVSAAHPMAAHPDQVFLDGKQLAQVASGTTPQAGQFAIDYAAKTITIGSNPNGHELRASDLGRAFVVGGKVTLQGFGIRRYATSLPDMGAVFLGGSVGGNVLENLVVEDIATQGIAACVGGGTFNHLTLAGNGMTGFMANRADGTTIENSVLSGNNTEDFNVQPNAAGMKIGRTNGLVVRDNDVTNNRGASGIWTDISVTNFVITGNHVSGNPEYGIETELSDTGIVANNYVAGARYGYTAFDTGNVQVFNNVFANNSVWDLGLTQDERRNHEASTQGVAPWLVRNITASNNIFGTSAAFQFYALDKATRIPANSMGIVVMGNEFPLGKPVMVGWGGGDNTTVTYYRSPGALNSGLGKSWNNVQTGGSMAAASVDTSNVAVPLPASVAAAVGVPAGTRHVGTF